MLEHALPQGHESFAATVFWFQAFHYKYLRMAAGDVSPIWSQN